MPLYCPVCAKYSDKFPTAQLRDDHLVEVHPLSEEALDITQRRRKGYAQDLVGKTTQNQ